MSSLEEIDRCLFPSRYLAFDNVASHGLIESDCLITKVRKVVAVCQLAHLMTETRKYHSLVQTSSEGPGINPQASSMVLHSKVHSLQMIQ